MTSEYVISGTVKDGVLSVPQLEKLFAAVKRWKNGDVLITVERVHATRSLEQNALYWTGYVRPLADFTGYDPRWIHAYLKKRFLPAKHLLIQNRHGEVVEEADVDALTTTRLNKNEFTEYLQAIEGWAAELGVSVGSNREHAA